MSYLTCKSEFLRTTKPNDYIINVTLSTVPEEEVDELRWFTGNATKRCYLKPTPCPVETPTGIVDVQCYCRKSDLCNKRESYLDMDLATNYTKVCSQLSTHLCRP